MNHGWVYRDLIKATDAGQTVLGYYSSRYNHSSASEWSSRISSGLVLLNGKPVATSTKLSPGDRLTYHREPWNEPEVPLDFAVIYEDRELLVINKPSGLPVLPGGGFLEHTLLWQLKQRYPQDTPVPIHRLGRGTSGLLLLARSPVAKSQLTQQLRNSTSGQGKQMQKVYRALVSGNPQRDRLTITQPIGKIPHPRLGYIYGATEAGKHAHSECQVVTRYPSYSLVEVNISTGRPHQIRIHLAAVGHPLLDDPLYISGGSFAEISPQQTSIPVPGDCGYFLQAYRLSFAHPKTSEFLTFELPMPQSWSEICIL